MAKTVDSASPATRSGPDAAVQIDLGNLPRVEAAARRRYWLGIVPDGPMDHDSRGGIEFQKFDRYPEWDEKGALLNADQVLRGKILELTDQQVALIKERVANVVLRVGSGPDGRKTIVQRICLASSPTYFPDERDVPLGHYLFMLPVSDAMPTNWRESIPRPMVAFATMLEAQARTPVRAAV